MANRAGFNPSDKVSKSSKGFDAAIAGLLTGTVTRSIIQPLDVFKIRYQLQVETRADAKYQNIRRAFVTIFKEEGIAAFWKGHMAAQYLSAIYMTAQFYGVDVFTRQLYSWFPSLNESGVNRTLIMSSGKFLFFLECSKSIKLHCVAKVYAVLPFYDVKSLCSGGRN